MLYVGLWVEIHPLALTDLRSYIRPSSHRIVNLPVQAFATLLESALHCSITRSAHNLSSSNRGARASEESGLVGT